MTSPFHLQPLASQYNRSDFSSGEEALDRYFQTQVTQDIKRRIANCFVALEKNTGQVVGYYTIASASIPTPDLPPEVTKRLPRYPTMPAVRIGRLAVDQRFHRRGLGAAMLADAIYRTLQAAPAVYTLLVDAKHEQAATFYEHHGFRRLSSQPKTLFLPLASAAKILPPPADG